MGGFEFIHFGLSRLIAVKLCGFKKKMASQRDPKLLYFKRGLVVIKNQAVLYVRHYYVMCSIFVPAGYLFLTSNVINEIKVIFIFIPDFLFIFIQNMV